MEENWGIMTYINNLHVHQQARWGANQLRVWTPWTRGAMSPAIRSMWITLQCQSVALVLVVQSLRRRVHSVQCIYQTLTVSDCSGSKLSAVSWDWLVWRIRARKAGSKRSGSKSTSTWHQLCAEQWLSIRLQLEKREASRTLLLSWSWKMSFSRFYIYDRTVQKSQTDWKQARSINI